MVADTLPLEGGPVCVFTCDFNKWAAHLICDVKLQLRPHLKDALF